MKKLRFFALAMAAVVSMGLVSCGEEEPDSQSVEIKNGEFLEVEGLGTDTTATYPVHFRVYLSEGQLVMENLTSQPTAAAQAAGMTSRECPTEAGISDFGKVKSLAKVNEYPSASSLKSSVAAAEGHGYVIEAHGAANIDGFHNEKFHDPVSQYMRIWLEESTADGFKVQYEFPFIEKD